LLSALDKILKRFDNSKIGRQFFNKDLSPFFGINLTQADLKVDVKIPLLKHALEYFKSGKRSLCQNREIKAMSRPSRPGADFRLASVNALSNSDIISGVSKLLRSSLVSLLLSTSGWLQMSGPRNLLIKSGSLLISQPGFL
jgi:hypothetical protein